LRSRANHQEYFNVKIFINCVLGLVLAFLLTLVACAIVWVNTNNSNLILLTCLPVLLWGYFLPWLIAYARGHHASLPIFVVNLFLGWSLIGWVGALVWAVMPTPEVAAMPTPAVPTPDQQPALSPLTADYFQRNEPRRASR
jgi:T4 superinfection immunity protein